jgi:lipoprotein-anchoring transpeptidase ErfK/SrfK
MSSSNINAFQAVQNAQNALQRGDKLSARRWAELATSLAPEREEPWLLLAAVASPQASVGYLKQALRINPASQRAKAGLGWAVKRIETAGSTTAKVRVSKAVEVPVQATPRMDSTQQVRVVPQAAEVAQVRLAETVVSAPKPASLPGNAKKYSGLVLAILLPLMLIGVLVFSIWNAYPVLAVFSSQGSTADSGHAPAWAQVKIAKPMLTPPPTATLMPTSASVEVLPTAGNETAEPTQTPEPEQTQSVSSEVEASPTPLPTDTGGPNTGQQSGSQPPVTYTGGKSILVDISEQHMYAYQGDTLVYSFVASTGMHNATRVGTFQILDKIPSAYGSTWDIWMPSWMGIYYAGSTENGIHALPILPNGATLWAGYLGTPISYGCVVLGSYEAQLLYDWADIGTPVIIQW